MTGRGDGNGTGPPIVTDLTESEVRVQVRTLTPTPVRVHPPRSGSRVSYVYGFPPSFTRTRPTFGRVDSLSVKSFPNNLHTGLITPYTFTLDTFHCVRSHTTPSRFSKNRDFSSPTLEATPHLTPRTYPHSPPLSRPVWSLLSSAGQPLQSRPRGGPGESPVYTSDTGH